MRILVAFPNGMAEGQRIPCYPWSYFDELRALGHFVRCTGDSEGEMWADGEPWDLYIQIENGRNEQGELVLDTCPDVQAPRAVVLIDSHGHPDLHAEVAKSYDHVFFAVWRRRDLFAGHPSAHWCPNATDLRWFDPLASGVNYDLKFDAGFFGSKKGLPRAAELIAACTANGWSYDVRQVASNRNPNRWPATARAMELCRILFNRGQKHDGPNQRVMESMAMFRPLLSDWDPDSGMGKLFEPWKHYAPYTDASSIEFAIRKLRNDRGFAYKMASAAFAEVKEKHQVKHRVQQILEVVS